MVLLNDALMNTIPSETLFLARLRARAAVFDAAAALAIIYSALLLLLNTAAWTFTCPRVGARTLATNWQPTTMTDAAIAPEIHESLDAH